MESVPDDDEKLQKLRTHRENILLALFKYGELPMGTLREKAEFPTGSRNHHTGVLEDWGLIEVIGRDGDDGERIFALTTDGSEFVEEYLKDTEPEGLTNRLDRLEERVDRVEERKVDRLNELEATLEKRTKALRALSKKVERLES